MKRHAYLIMVHNNFGVLEKLIRLIDDARNDIYIHIDAKVEDFDQVFFAKIPTKSNIYFTERIPISWGWGIQVQCELSLLEVNHSYFL
ncbi:hypothetical protein [Peribacillus simplex]|uniref:hypothetical protein n=1 Tax=Peribacillus simplex TaxID=1478 RepID=UPI0024C15100|nr:hypothetical protein [Peribacillus simplex]WHX89892.1 hypothetical protein QNH50_17865 [Peribacillus simplex]